MISFDVESLYTNIPITDALLVIKDLLSNDTILQDRTNLLPDQILELLEFLLRTTFFIFNGEFHQQTNGVAMGGPASSIVAEIYMISIETTAMCTFQIVGGCQGRRTGVGVTTVSNSLILGGWVTKVLNNGDKK